MKRWLAVITICLWLCVLCACTTNTPPAEDTTATTTVTEPTTTYTGVALRMPDSISESYYSYDCKVTVKVVQVNANTVKYTRAYDDGGDSGPQYVSLREECILELNALYDAITDFSGETGGTSNYLIQQGDQQYSVGWGGANQWELNRYLHKIFNCSAYGLEEWYMFDDLFKPSEE